MIEYNPDNTGSGPTLNLPEPDSAAREHSQRLLDRVREEIGKCAGVINFRRYMEMALYEPGLGYYSAGARKFGRAGDFTTAPELSDLYSRCIARQCAEILEHTGGGIILELGAGSGVMARDLLTELDRLECLPAQYLILETSADLRQRQQQLLASTHSASNADIVWLDSLPPEPINGVILASEVLDALPVHRIVFDGDDVSELAVACRSGGLAYKPVPPDATLSEGAQLLRRYWPGTMPARYTTEINLELAGWLASFADILAQGVMLIVDYGYPGAEYYHPQRTDGTLKCHYRHQLHNNPFFYPGLQDITAAVDFTGVAEAALEAGFNVMGYTTQGYFLLACGLSEMLIETAQDDFRSLQLSQQAKLLTMPAEMGEQFKVIALGKNYSQPLRGFGAADQRRRL
jgi:SAM-dependent MidA family methyltransferase